MINGRILSGVRDLVALGQTGREGARDGKGVRFGRAEAGQRWLENEECGANKNADEDEEEPLFFKEVVYRSGDGKGSGVFEGFGRVWRVWTHGHLLVSSVINAGLFVQLFHAGNFNFNPTVSVLCLV